MAKIAQKMRSIYDEKMLYKGKKGQKMPEIFIGKKATLLNRELYNETRLIWCQKIYGIFCPPLFDRFCIDLFLV